MENWQKRLKGNPIPWLLEENNPCVRYFALADLLQRPAHDPAVHSSRRAILDAPFVQAVCSEQCPNGAWPGTDYYLPKGCGTFWRLTLLGDLGLSLANHCDLVRAACEFSFRHQAENGAFQRIRRQKARELKLRGEPCTQARFVRALAQLGYGEDPRTKRAIAWLVHTQRDDGAWLCERRNMEHGCLRATVDYLRAVELFPTMHKNPTTRRAAEWVADRLLQPSMGRYHVREAWNVFEFPYFNYSLIPTLHALLQTSLGADHPLIARALDYLLERQRDDGTWALDAAPRCPADLGRVGEPNKWLTLDALRVLRLAYN